jgi:hypothetical protein
MAFPIDQPTIAHASTHGYTLIRRPTHPAPFPLNPELYDLATHACSADDLYALHLFVASLTIAPFAPDLTHDILRQARLRFLDNIIHTPHGPMTRSQALHTAMLPTGTDPPMPEPNVNSGLFPRPPNIWMLLNPLLAFFPHLLDLDRA